MDKDSKIIVLGAGVMGLSTTLSLLERGYSNISIFDKRDYLNQKYSYFKGCDSASSDLNKIFRSSYGKEVHYQQMSNISMQKFKQWNKEIEEENWEGGVPIYLNTGNVYLSDKIDLPEFERETIRNMPDQTIHITDDDAVDKALQKGLDACAVDPFQMKARGKHLQGILDTTGGMTLADKSCRWVLKKCLEIGQGKLKTFFGEAGVFQELLLKERTCIGIRTSDDVCHYCDHLIVCTGAWTAEVIPEAGEKIEATAGSVCLFKIDDKETQEKYNQYKFPTWSYKIKDGAIGGLYGFPCTEGYMKIGYRGLKWINPQKGINSKVKTRWSGDEKEINIPLFALKQIKNFVREHIPEITKVSATRLCWYSDSEDNDYLISYCPYYDNKSVFVMGGDSGHCFKFLGSVGDVAVDIINDCGSEMFKQLFSWERPRDKLNVINAGENDPRVLDETVFATPKDWWIKEPAKL